MDFYCRSFSLSILDIIYNKKRGRNNPGIHQGCREANYALLLEHFRIRIKCLHKIYTYDKERHRLPWYKNTVHEQNRTQNTTCVIFPTVCTWENAHCTHQWGTCRMIHFNTNLKFSPQNTFFFLFLFLFLLFSLLLFLSWLWWSWSSSSFLKENLTFSSEQRP